MKIKNKKKRQIQILEMKIIMSDKNNTLINDTLDSGEKTFNLDRNTQKK